MAEPRTVPMREWSAYKAHIVGLANKTGAELSGCGFDAIRFLVAANDIAFAVWQDRGEPDGVAVMIIKGRQAMREIVADDTSRTVSMTAVPCRSVEEAEALYRVIGEADARH